MPGGFALVAYPAKYGSSGVMTFIVNRDRVVYEKDLGNNEEIWEIFQEIRQNDEEAVQRLREALQQLIGSGSESEEEAA